MSSSPVPRLDLLVSKVNNSPPTHSARMGLNVEILTESILQGGYIFISIVVDVVVDVNLHFAYGRLVNEVSVSQYNSY